MRREGKKLIRAARLYARSQLVFVNPDQPDDETQDADDRDEGGKEDSAEFALSVFGLALSEPVGRPAERKFRLWRCHEPVFRLWCAVQTQWRYRPAGMGASIPCGLDYTGVDSVRRGLGIKCGEYTEMFPWIQVMERAALEVFAEPKSA